MSDLGIYESMAQRTQGDVYIGVTGPVRTGKSTFIKRFMDLLVLPNIQDVYEKQRIIDEMPQSGLGRTITTTEPKFIPQEAASLVLPHNTGFRVKMVDCVGFVVPGAMGYMENEMPRLVRTPWKEEPIPFEEAAEMGTEKVIKEHSTIGIMVTTDGTIGEIPRDDYLEAEEKTVAELRRAGKPFAVILNTTSPESEEAVSLARRLEEKYETPVAVADCMNMTREKLDEILTDTLYQFPVLCINFNLPGFIDGIQTDHQLKAGLIGRIREWAEKLVTVYDVISSSNQLEDGDVVRSAQINKVDLSTGAVTVNMQLDDSLFYGIIEEYLGEKIAGDKEFFRIIRELAAARNHYRKIEDAMKQVEETGYGIVQPRLAEMTLEEPEVFKQGSKFGIRLTAKAPSLHIIKTDITTEISPIVGTETQSEDLLAYLQKEFKADPADILNTNIFGKPLREMVTEQMENKILNVPDDIREKIRKSLQKISDDGKDYFICIVI